MARYIGKEIGGYHIIESIGAGGMAAVFKAYQASFDRFVALKILPEHFAQDQSYVDRFIREAKIIARLEHRHILPVYDFGSDDEITYLSMRYLQAGTLKDLVARTENHKLPLGDTVRIVAQIAEALDCAHEQNIVHRDVKPSNILVDKLGDAYLMDFGIAKILDATSQLTQTGGTVGTPAYMSPEQAAGTEIDSRADIYALGIILFELMVGQVPFTANTPVAVILAHITTPPPNPSSLNPDIPPAIEQIILKALAKKPEERYRSAGEFANALKDAVDKEPIGASTDVLQMSSDLAADKSPEDVTLADRQLIKKIARQARVRKFVPWALGIAATIALVFGIVSTTGVVEAIQGTPTIDFNEVATLQQLAMEEGERRTATAIVEIENMTATARMAATIAAYSPTPSETPAPDENATQSAISLETATPSITPIPSDTPTPTATATQTNTPTPTAIPPEDGDMIVSEIDGMEMLYVSAGEFIMGSELRYDFASPVHTVYLDAFWIDKTEVTNAMFRLCVEAGGCDNWFVLDETSRYNNNFYVEHPVTGVVWSKAVDYCTWAGRRLPTEAEWEKAARGTDGRTYPWGEGLDSSLANITYSIVNTTRAGYYPYGASPYGALDMAGNVWEWVADWYDSDYYASSPSENPTGPASGSYRVARGGGWTVTLHPVHSASRYYRSPHETGHELGFRCAVSAQP